MSPSGAYYNEHDPFAAAWLRELIAGGHIAPGEVDERGIRTVSGADLGGFTQCHFFAGIGGWSYALRLAGWGDDRPVWTGSCPCQPFSAAGAQQGVDDPRHLWPTFARLIGECKPPVVFGEQVEAAIGHGWLDLVSDDLEREGYAVGAVGLPAACVGAPHIRQRLWFVAESDDGQSRDGGVQRGGGHLQWEADAVVVTGLEHPEGDGRQQRRPLAGERGVVGGCGVDGLGLPKGKQPHGSGDPRRGWGESPDLGELGHPDPARSQGRGLPRSTPSGDRPHRQPLGPSGPDGPDSVGVVLAPSEQVGVPGCPREPRTAAVNFWSSPDWLPCRDGKSRPVEPGTFPLAHGVPARVGRLRGYGNAIVPQVAAEVIRAYMECRRGG